MLQALHTLSFDPHSFLQGRGLESILQVKKLKPRGEVGLTRSHTAMPSVDEVLNSRVLGPDYLGSDSRLLLAKWPCQVLFNL